ncbi:MAG TPA: type IV secretion system protein, partial [Symbiobacteriaceae bacterium]
AVGGLTRGVMASLMNVTSWNAWEPWKSFDPKSITDAGMATVLGLMGLLIWIAAIGHLLVILARDAALMVLVATGPIAAAGLVNEGTRAWFWKAFRWFHAAVATPLLVVMVTGVGMKFAEGVVAGKAGSMEASIGTALPAIVLICISVVSPVALFKLLAFVDPGTASGASMRAGMQAMGGVQGLMRGNASAGVADDNAWQSRGAQSAGEASADAATTTRVTSAVQQGSSFLGPIGAGLAAGLGVVTRVGSIGTSLVTDLTNQEGVGHNTYQPDYQGGYGDGAARANREANATDHDPGSDDSAPSLTGSGGGMSDAADPFSPGGPPSAGSSSTSGVSGPAGGTGGSGTAAGGAGGASAAEVAVVAL